MKCETKLSPKQQALAFLEAGRAMRASPRVAESPSSPENAPSSHIGPALANAADSPRSEDPEARRIAAELVKLHRDSAISGPNDPEARCWAKLIHTFGATYTGYSRFNK